MSAPDAVDVCAGRPAEGGKCKFVTVRRSESTPTPVNFREAYAKD